MDYDADRITYTNQNLAGPGQDDGLDDGGMSAVEAKRQFREFIRSYREGNLFPYRDQVQYHEAQLCVVVLVEFRPQESVKMRRKRVVKDVVTTSCQHVELCFVSHISNSTP